MGYEDHGKLSSVGFKKDPFKLHAYLELIAHNRDREKELKLLIDEQGQPFAVRSCIIHRNGSVKWSEIDDSICRDEVRINFICKYFRF